MFLKLKLWVDCYFAYDLIRTSSEAKFVSTVLEQQYLRSRVTQTNEIYYLMKSPNLYSVICLFKKDNAKCILKICVQGFTNN